MLRKLLPIALLAIGAGGLAALAITRPKPEPLEPQEKVWVVSAQSVRPQTISPTLTLYARVDSPRVTTLTAAVSADVREVLALEGQRVTRDAVLVRLDDRDAKLVLEQRDAEVAEILAEIASEKRRHANDRSALAHEERLLALARRDVKRAEDLATRDLGSAARLDEARQAEARQALSLDNRRLAIAEHESRDAALRARLKRAQSLAAMAQLDLERTTVRAPFAGRIADVEVSEGDRVRPGDRLITLFDADRIELRAQAATRYLGLLRRSLHDGIEVYAVARVDGERVEAVLDRLGAEVEPGRGAADTLFRVTGPDRGVLELNRTVELLVSLPPVQDVVPVPAEALYGTDRVYALVDGRMRAIEVQRFGEHRDPSGGRYLLVASPQLAAGDPIVTTQLPNAVDGLKVRVAAPGATTSKAAD